MSGKWRSLDYWRWWWRNTAATELKLGLSVGFVVLVLIAGYLAAGRLTGASAASTDLATYSYDTTVQKLVRVREHGRIVVKRVPVVVRHVVVRPVTAFETLIDTRVITTPGGVRIVKRKVTRYVPVVRKRIITKNGKTTTVTQTQLVPTVKTETQVVTDERTVVNQNTVVVTSNHSQTVTQPVTQTQTQTETRIVVPPPDTVTETKTETDVETQTVTATETVTETETVTLPGVTITITVPL